MDRTQRDDHSQTWRRCLHSDYSPGRGEMTSGDRRDIYLHLDDWLLRLWILILFTDADFDSVNQCRNKISHCAFIRLQFLSRVTDCNGSQFPTPTEKHCALVMRQSQINLQFKSLVKSNHDSLLDGRVKKKFTGSDGTVAVAADTERPSLTCYLHAWQGTGGSCHSLADSSNGEPVTIATTAA